ncbi:MAG: exosortase A [Methylococcaceae bacterium]|nr:exosortase A [Methylococcaceae bacterium]
MSLLTGSDERISPWGKAAAAAILSALLLLVIYHETFLAMVNTWRNSETFTHCFLIFPISAYLIWKRRSALARLRPDPDYRALVFLIPLGLIWLVGNHANVMSVQQFAMMGMIPMTVWLILGWPVVSEIAFPLGFLLFGVPFGEFLIPPMMDFTADFTVLLLQLTGIPVYREGTYFSIPSGDWSVVEACSGFRYLLASITLGFLFAYVSYRSLWKRGVFVVAACIVPVIANGLRAYLIVMIAHWSNMKLAVGVDHFIYGWVFFGLVMALLFWVGSKWIEQEPAVPPLAAEPSTSTEGDAWRLPIAALLALSVSLLWPLRAAYIENKAASRQTPIVLTLPESGAPWRLGDALTAWVPSYIGADVERQAFYTDGHHTVAIYVRYYRYQGPGHELVSTQNMLVSQTGSEWKMPGESSVKINLGREKIDAVEGRLLSPGQSLLTWRWNWISGDYTGSPVLAKFLEARDKFIGHIGDEAGIVLAVDLSDDVSSSRQALQGFVDAMFPAIDQSLRQAAAEARP